jgi:hypothetical protein
MSPSDAITLYAISLLGAAVLVGVAIVLAGWVVARAILRATDREIEALSAPQPARQVRVRPGAPESP